MIQIEESPLETWGVMFAFIGIIAFMIAGAFCKCEICMQGFKEPSQPTSLGDNIKAQEKLFEMEIAPSDFLIIRLDGHALSKFSKICFEKYDETFSKMMLETTKELHKIMQFNLAFTQSDEITLVCFPTYPCHLFNGRSQKLSSLIASYASVIFNRLCNELDNEKLKKFIKVKEVVFDARVFALEEKKEVAEMLNWRYIDARRNGISRLCEISFPNKSNKSYKNVTTGERFKLLQEKKILKPFNLETEEKYEINDEMNCKYTHLLNGTFFTCKNKKLETFNLHRPTLAKLEELIF